MARKFRMTWFEPRKCWYVTREGRRYYCPIKCRGKTIDQDGYLSSLAWWREKEKELEKALTVVSPSFPPLDADDRKQIKKLMSEREGMTEESATLMVLGWKEMALDPLSGLSDAAKWMAMERDRQAKLAVKQDTMEVIVKKFLDFKVSQAVTGMKSAGRVINLVTYLKQFKTFVGADRPLTDINAMTLFDYHAKTLKDIGTDQLSESAGRDRIQIAKQFIRWAWELGMLELPRNIESKELTIYVTQKEIKVFEFAELKKLINGAPEPLKVYLLLMANCGMTAMDVGDLLNSEINATAGTITRVRSKRQKRRSGSGSKEEAKVKITTKLWPKTLELLLKRRDKSSRYAFTSADGGQLAYTKIDPETYKGCDVDLIDKAYRKHRRATDGEKAIILPLKAIRATSATRIGEHPEYARYAQYFLGQAPKSVAEKFYVKPSQSQFDQCVRWLGQQYGFVELDEVPIIAKAS